MTLFTEKPLPQTLEEDSTVFSLSENQNDALEHMLSFIVDDTKQIFVLRGYSGAGKTTLIKHLLHNISPYITMLSAANPDLIEPNIILSATTNKAAQVLEEGTETETSTIHSVLSLKLKTDYRTGKETLMPTKKEAEVAKELRNTILVIDEISMANRELLKHLYNSLHSTTKLILVGDPYQLAPVNEKFSSAFFSEFPEFSLQGVKRQTDDSPIIKFGEQIRNTIQTGVFKPIEFDGKAMIHLEGPEFQAKVNEMFQDKAYGEDSKILAWSNQKVIEYNNYIRGLFTSNPMPQIDEFWIANSTVVDNHDNVLIKNNAQVKIKESNESFMVSPQYDFPGDSIPYYEVRTEKGITVRIPQDIHLYNSVLKHLAKESRKNRNWMEFYQFKNSYADLRPGYSLTVHKSQGSTFKDVYIDLYDIGRCNNPDDVARMLYVAVTRAKEKVYFYGHLPDKYQGK